MASARTPRTSSPARPSELGTAIVMCPLSGRGRRSATVEGPHLPGPCGGEKCASLVGVPDAPGRRDLDELLDEVRDRMDEIVTTRDHMQELLGAVLAVASGLELEPTLLRIVQAAVDLVGARYGALGVLGTRDDLSEFLHVGVDEVTRASMGRLPEGKGL